MAYKFDGGNLSVICDVCRVIIDSGVSTDEYEEIYEASEDDGDICWRCKAGLPTRREEEKGTIIVE